MTEAFRSYKSGILTEEFMHCSDDKMSINHAVTIVGFGKSDRLKVESSWCKQYWIAQNSWGAQWGEQGFFKLCMDDAGKSKTPLGTCQINLFTAYHTLNLN